MAPTTSNVLAAGAGPEARLLAFVGFSTMTVLGGRFAYYAALNRREGIDSQEVIWEYLAFGGVTASLYGTLGLAQLVFAVGTVFRDGVLLAFVLLLALTLREVYFNGAFAVSERERDSRASRPRRLVEFGFIVATTAAVFRAGFFGDALSLGLFEAGSAATFVAYGIFFGRRHVRRAGVSGTMLDDVVRHLLPLALFAGLAVATDIAVLAVPATTAAILRGVFVVMAATTLMAATIKLRQNVAGLRGDR